MAPTQVDTSLHPYPSGRAESFAKAHSSSHPLILYGGWFCPFVQRTWILLHEKNIPHEYKEINPYHKEPDFLALNPRGLVPTLAVPVTDDDSSDDSNPSTSENQQTRKPLYESTVICSYLDETYTNPSKYGPSSLPSSPYERARCRIWIDHISTRIIPLFYRFIQHTPTKNYTLTSVREEFLQALKTFITECSPATSGPYFLGKSFSMVDIMLAPWARRMFLIDHYKGGGVGIPEEGKGGEDEEIWGRWRVWFAAVMDRDSVKDTWSEDERYIEAYKRYAEDTTGSQVGHATRSGRGLP